MAEVLPGQAPSTLVYWKLMTLLELAAINSLPSQKVGEAVESVSPPEPKLMPFRRIRFSVWLGTVAS